MGRVNGCDGNLCYEHYSTMLRIRNNLSNCKLAYADADLSSAHAVVFHLHKVVYKLSLYFIVYFSFFIIYSLFKKKLIVFEKLQRSEVREMDKLTREAWQR